MEPALRGVKRRRLLGLALAFGLLPAGPVARAQQPSVDERREVQREETSERWPSGKRGKVILMWEHLEDDNQGGGEDRDFEDFYTFVSYKQAHFQAWIGEFTDGFQIGGYLRDGRRSTYSGLYRFRNGFDHTLQFDTEQILGHGFVYAAMLRGIDVIHHDRKERDPALAGERVGDDIQLQFGTGLDWYWGEYNFLTFRAISDPREGGRWSFITSHRFHNGEQIYVQPGYIIRTDRSTGWFVKGKIKAFVWMIGDYNRFDFADVDRTIYAAGVEIPY
ncbi:MAG: hypothetical protein V3U98_02830 [Acidobacteriota bacterium]